MDHNDTLVGTSMYTATKSKPCTKVVTDCSINLTKEDCNISYIPDKQKSCAWDVCGDGCDGPFSRLGCIRPSS